MGVGAPDLKPFSALVQFDLASGHGFNSLVKFLDLNQIFGGYHLPKQATEVETC